MWSNFGFQQELTLDGSPTLRLLHSLPLPNDRPPESMHHSGGAFSETEFIYGALSTLVLRQIPQPRFVCVGLGLGYIEMQLAQKCLIHKIENIGLLQSFESEIQLKLLFKKWLYDQDLPNECRSTYDLVAQFNVANTNLSIQDLKNKLRSWYETKIWTMEEALGPDLKERPADQRFHGIFYDAFSRKTTEGLWSEEFLNKFLKKSAAENCGLATYACLGNLKRALKEQSFTVYLRPGFLGKRNSTLGLRGLSLDSLTISE